MTDIFGVVEALRADNSRLAKEKILKDNFENEELKRVLNYALDPYRQFYIRKIPAYSAASEGGLFDEEIHDLSWALDQLHKLSDRVVTGHAGRDHLQTILEGISVRDAEVIKLVIGKDIRAGVQTSTVNKIWTDLVPTFKIQLAESYNEKVLRKYFETPGAYMYAEPKIDGLRALNFYRGSGDHVFYTRSGKEIETMDHLIPQIEAMFDVGVIVDGEGTSTSFQESMSDIKRGSAKEGVDIFLNIFDLITIEEFDAQKCDLTYEQRRARIEKAFSDAAEVGLIPPHLRLNPVKRVNSFEEAKEAYGEHIEAGYEGTILKTPDGLYEFDRTNSWMKIKPVETADVEIIGFQEGTKKNVGKLGALIFRWGENRTGRCGMGLSDKQRQEFWDNQSEYMGQLFELEYMEPTEEKFDADGKYTGGGIPRHGRFIRLRSFKGEKA